jgi:SsrA-binding protein
LLHHPAREQAGLVSGKDHPILADMAKSKDTETKGGGTIALNKRARYEYHIDTRYEAGIALQGWELKALRAGRINFGDSYAVVLHSEVFLVGASIPPLISASSHVVADDRRTRKLLLHREEIDRLIGAVERKGYTLVPIAMYWKNNKVKVEIGVARGKQEHDKRATEKDREWSRDKERVMRAHNKPA